jgi:hypothetical protein
MDTNAIIPLVLQYSGLLGFTLAGLVGAAYGLFKWLGGKWLETKFAERLVSLKYEQDQAIRHVQSSIDREVHRAKKLYDREFDALSDAWGKLQKAYSAGRQLMQENYYDFRRLSANEAESLLEDLELKPFRFEELKALRPEQQTEEVRKIFVGRQHDAALNLRYELSGCLGLNGPFMTKDIADRFFKIDGMIMMAIAEAHTRRDGRYNGDFDQVTKLLAKGQELVNELEDLLRERFWSASTEQTAV